MIARVVGGIALADFRDRVRRPAYAVTLMAAIGLGYLAAPAADSHWVVMYIGSYRGIYNSPYIGTLIAFASALWLTLGGFYVVRNSIARDRSTGVGQLIAATPVRTVSYLAGKFLSNCLVLTSMVGVLAVTALVLQLARGESRSVDLVALLEPFVLISLPLVALTAAGALVFEAVPLLRSGLGNIVWFVAWMIIAIGGQSPNAPFGGIGVHVAARSMRDTIVAQRLDTETGEFSLGLMYVDDPLHTFVWEGTPLTGGFVAGRLALVLFAIGLALLPTFWFGRFDPSRSRQPHTVVPQDAERYGWPQVAGPVPGAMVAGAGLQTQGPGSVATLAPPRVESATATQPRSTPKQGGGFTRLLLGEIHILLQGVSRWWWLGAACIVFAGLVAPIGAATVIMLPLAWIWPILLWSRLGTQRHEYGVEALLGAYPRVRRRLLAEWAAGVVVTALVGVAPAIRMVLTSDGAGVAAWLGGAVFIPSLAMMLGVLARTHRLFQAGYLLLWFAVVNGIAFVDFMGAVRESGRPTGPSPLLVAGAAALMLAVVFAAGVVRRQRPDET